MSRPLDHVVHAVRDLDAAATLYERLGFRVGARNRHPWGTHNRIVQFPGSFVELLTVGEAERIPPHAPRRFSFGAFNRDFLSAREGLAMLALGSSDAAADAAAFARAGIGDFETFGFERESRRPDNSVAKVAFTLSFADPQSAEAGFFTCQHHHPENFWNPAFQVHSNTATRIAAVVMVADNPSDHHIFLSAFAGERELQSSSAGIVLRARNSELQVMDKAAFRAHFGREPEIGTGLRLAALRFSVADPATALTIARQAGCGAALHMDRVVVPPASAMGATLVFQHD